MRTIVIISAMLLWSMYNNKSSRCARWEKVQAAARRGTFSRRAQREKMCDSGGLRSHLACEIPIPSITITYEISDTREFGKLWEVFPKLMSYLGSDWQSFRIASLI